MGIQTPPAADSPVVVSAIAGYLSELTSRLQARLEDRLEGVWLIGSGALGDFDRLRSDIDVQAVCTTRLARRSYSSSRPRSRTKHCRARSAA